MNRAREWATGETGTEKSTKGFGLIRKGIKGTGYQCVCKTVEYGFHRCPLYIEPEITGLVSLVGIQANDDLHQVKPNLGAIGGGGVMVTG